MRHPVFGGRYSSFTFTRAANHEFLPCRTSCSMLKGCTLTTDLDSMNSGVCSSACLYVRPFIAPCPNSSRLRRTGWHKSNLPAPSTRAPSHCYSTLTRLFYPHILRCLCMCHLRTWTRPDIYIVRRQSCNRTLIFPNK